MAKGQFLHRFLKSNLDKRVELNENFISAIYKIIETSEFIWNLPRINRFTDHSLNHSYSVFTYALDLSKAFSSPLSGIEVFLLASASFLHDIGMQFGHFMPKNRMTGEHNETWQNIRSAHAENSTLMLKALFGDKAALAQMTGGQATLEPIKPYLNELKIPISGIVSKINTIILSHTKDSYGRESGWYNSCTIPSQPNPRIDLLSAVIRYADELDLGQKRIADYSMFERHEIPISSLEYWLGASLISNINIYSHNSFITLEIIPDYSLIPEDTELSDFSFFLIYRQYKKLIRSLMKPIIPQLPCIADIFSKYGFSVRILTPDFKSNGTLLKSSSTLSEHYSCLELLYEFFSKEGFPLDYSNIQFFEFPNSPSFKLCLLQENSGLRIPKLFKQRIADWVRTRISTVVKDTNYHTAFHRVSKEANFIEEFLPDNDPAPYSIFGVAAATKASCYDLKNIRILPSNIECSSQLNKDSVSINFPSFKRIENLSGKPICSVGPWDIIQLFYLPPGESLSKSRSSPRSTVFALITQLGDATFLTIPSDQNVILPPSDDGEVMRGAGICRFFMENETDRLNKSAWKKNREKLLAEISKDVKRNFKISGRLISSIIGYMDDRDVYQCITWRDDKPKIPDYIHIGVISSALFLLDSEHRDNFIGSPFNISDDNFPDKASNSINIALWGDKKKGKFEVFYLNKKLVVNVDSIKVSDLKLQQII